MSVLEAALADLRLINPTVKRTSAGLQVGPVIITVSRGGDKVLRAIEAIARGVDPGGEE